MASTNNGKADLGSLKTGCEDSVPLKATAQRPHSYTVDKWNYSDSQRSETGISSKNESEQLIAMGTAVSVAVENFCWRGGFASEKLKELLADDEIEEYSLARGEYSYHSLHLDKAWEVSKLRELVESDECVVTFEEQKFLKPSAFPSDPHMDRQPFWGNLSYPQYYDQFFSAITSSVIVAVIDSGIDLDHEDLAPSIWVNTGEIAGNSVDDDGNGYVDDLHGYHFVANDGDPDPDTQLSAYNTHGTAVAGLIGAVENNIGIVGVMPSHIKIMSLNVFGESGSSDVNDVAEAIEYAVSNGAKVINLSLAGRSNSTIIQTALINAVAAGVVVVVAAGNDGVEITPSNFYAPVGYAKDIDGVIAVGATVSDSREMAPYSNFNPEYVEMAAPGSSTFSGGPTGLFSLDVDNGFDYYDGTSFSAPLVAGAAALTTAMLQSRGDTFTAADIENIIKGSSDQFQSLSGLIQQCRILNFQKLHEAIVNR